MPGYQPVRIMQPSSYFHKNEQIYGQIKSKKKSKGSHPLFEDLRSRNHKEKMDYEHYLRNKDVIRTDPSGHNFNSLKLLGSCNDISYLDSFMSMPRQRHHSVSNESESFNRSRPLAKSSTAIFGKGDKRNSIHTDNVAVTAAMFTSLRNSNSEDNLYESMEMIHYLKTMQSLNRQKKTRSVQRTGHPLFDSLREEQAMREPLRKISSSKKPDEHGLQSSRNSEYLGSEGNSPSLSPSSSGDEYDNIYPRMVVKAPKNGYQKSVNPHRRFSEQMHHNHNHNHKRQEKQKVLPKKKMSECNNGSESDDDFKIIPRPKFFGKGFLTTPSAQKTQQLQQQQRKRSTASTPSDESDSSFHSGALR